MSRPSPAFSSTWRFKCGSVPTRMQGAPPTPSLALLELPISPADAETWHFLIHSVCCRGGRLLALFQLIAFSLSHGIECWLLLEILFTFIVLEINGNLLGSDTALTFISCFQCCSEVCYLCFFRGAFLRNSKGYTTGYSPICYFKLDVFVTSDFIIRKFYLNYCLFLYLYQS